MTATPDDWEEMTEKEANEDGVFDCCQWPVGGPRLWPIENPHFAGCF
jgi:hypothetical protein